MTSANSKIYPRRTTDSSIIVLEKDLPLITYDRSDSKSAQELLYAAASQSDENKARRKWEAFDHKVDNDSLTNKEIQKLIQTLDEQKQWSALHYAVANNNYFVTEILIGETFLYTNRRYKCNVNILGGNGENVLHVVAQSNKIWSKNNSYQSQDLKKNIPSIVKMLIERQWFETSIQIDHDDEEGRTPLHLAVMANRHSFASYLLKNGARLEATTKTNANVFHFIFIPSDPLQTEADLERMVTLLYDEAKENHRLYLLQSQTLENRSPLVLAVCHPKCTKTIVDRLTEKTDTNQLLLAFDLAAKQHIFNDTLLKPLLVDFNSRAPNQRNKLIQIACRHNHVEMLKWLIEEDSFNKDIHMESYTGYTPLLTAVFYEAKECVEYLLEKRIDIDWKKQNDDDETILHILAKRTDPSLDLFNMIWDRMKFSERKDVNMIKDNAGNTPLHCAARFNQLQICQRLLGITDNTIDSLTSLWLMTMLEEKNALGQTAVLVACDMGHEKIVEYFWDVNNKYRQSGIFKRDDDRKSCLHLAAAKGYRNVVEYLVETIKMDVDSIADRRITPLHLACQYGHSDVVKYLLDHKASPTLRDARLYNCLEIAIMNHQDKLVQEVLFNHPLWRDMMRNAQPIKGTKAYDTPMRKLIRYMPKVTVYIIDNKFTRLVGGPGQKVFKRVYDYEFFQDELTVERWYTQGTIPNPPSKSFRDRWKKLSWTETIRCAFCCFCCKDSSTNDSNSKPYTDDSYTLVRNHPLFIASRQSSCPELVQHPFNICLRLKKFHMFGIYLLILSCLLYSAYLSIFTALVLQNKHPQYFYDLINVNYTDDLGTCEYVSNTLVNRNNPEIFKSASHKILRWIAFGFLILFILKNLILIISLFPKLLRMGTYYLEIAVLVLSFVYIFDWYDWLSPVLLRCPIQYQLGSFALLLAWINFLTYVRYVPIARIGIYVVMLQVILFKFLQFLPVLMIIICGFGLSFWMLLQNQSVYKTPVEALIRTGLMIFDLGYEDRLYKPSEGGIGYYKILYVLFILTGIVLSIFVINLMISLAVGELPSLNDQSIIWRHQKMYDLLSDYEILRVQLRPLIDCLTCGYLTRTKRRGPGIFKFLQRRQDLTIQQDENHVFCLVRFGRYMQKHFFEERIQDNVKLPIDKEDKKAKD